MKYLLLKIEFFSPYSSTPLFAEHGRGLIAPPPSTLIGALAASYYYPRETEIPDTFIEKIKYVSFWVPTYTEAENISRHFTMFSQKPQRIEALKSAIDVILGEKIDEKKAKVFFNYGGLRKEKGQSIEAALLQLKKAGLSDHDIARQVLQIFYQPATLLEVYYWDPAYIFYIIDDDTIVNRAPYIFRIGRKEGLVATTPLEILKIEKVRYVKTRFYLPCKALRGGCNGIIEYMSQKPGDFSTEPYCVPHRALHFIEDAPAEGWVGLKIIAGENGIRKEMDIVVPEKYVNVHQ
jgi:CRISPR-associated protein Cas5a/b/c